MASRFTKLLLEFDGGKRMAFPDGRRFGRVLLRDEPEASPPISLLAPDPVEDPPSLEHFTVSCAASKCPVKALLLNQSGVVCGVGNWMADEILYAAAVHPATLSCALSREEVEAVREALLTVAKTACAAGAKSSLFPKEWLFHYRWSKRLDVPGKGNSREKLGDVAKRGKKSGGKSTGDTEVAGRDQSDDVSAPRMANGSIIKFSVVGGRTTAFVPSVQGEHPGAFPAPRVLRRPATSQASHVMKRPSADFSRTSNMKKSRFF